MNWNQTGMPTVFVSRLGLKREIAELKSVPSDAQNHIGRPEDAEAMVQELVESGGSSKVAKSKADGLAEWEEWDRRFKALLG